jgi:drug/metabolite transporter (DMT)-like permease
MVFLGSVVPYLLYVVALTELSASRVAAFNYAQPLVTVVLGAWLLAETLTSRVVLCGVIILVGVYITERGRDDGQPTKDAGKATPQ